MAGAGCELVFITAYDEYAVEAFEQGRGRLRAQARRARAPRAHRRAAAQAPRQRERGEGPALGGMQQLLQKLSAHMNRARRRS